MSFLFYSHRWFLFGSIFITAASAIVLANSYNEVIGSDDSFLSRPAFRASWALLVVSGVFCTIGSVRTWFFLSSVFFIFLHFSFLFFFLPRLFLFPFFPPSCCFCCVVCFCTCHEQPSHGLPFQMPTFLHWWALRLLDVCAGYIPSRTVLSGERTFCLDSIFN